MTHRDPRLTGVTSASIHDAVSRRYRHVCHVLDLVSPRPERTLFGQAVTVRLLPMREDVFDAREHDFARVFYSAVGTADGAGAGKVLVLSSAGHVHSAVIGGTKAARLHHRGCAGLITDARVRDFAELAAYDFATWCAGETHRAAGQVLYPQAVNVPVTLGDATVLPGDWIYADRAGTVIVPAGDIDAVLDDAIAIEAADKAKIAAAADEDPTAIVGD